MNDELRHPQRAINVSTIENARDLGGYRTRDGGETCFGVFVRTGDMHSASKADQAALRDYGINTVIDLRMNWEVEAQPNVFATSQIVNFKRHDFWGDRFDDYRSKDKKAAPAKKLADLYCAGLEQSGFVMADIMQTLADAEAGSLFHCRSGKDRTGLVAAMLLAIAGVPEETICEDFGLTSDYLKQDAINPIEASAPGAWQKTCEPETMALTLAYLRDNYGGPIGYLEQQGVSATQLQAIKDRLG